MVPPWNGTKQESRLDPLEVGNYATSNTHDICWCCTEVVIPRSRSRPHFVVLQQVRIYEHAQLCAVTKGRHATVGLGNLPALELNL